jgi:hypothetical protein
VLALLDASHCRCRDAALTAMANRPLSDAALTAMANRPLSDAALTAMANRSRPLRLERAADSYVLIEGLSHCLPSASLASSADFDPTMDMPFALRAAFRSDIFMVPACSRGVRGIQGV